MAAGPSTAGPYPAPPDGLAAFSRSYALSFCINASETSKLA